LVLYHLTIGVQKTMGQYIAVNLTKFESAKNKIKIKIKIKTLLGMY